MATQVTRENWKEKLKPGTKLRVIGLGFSVRRGNVGSLEAIEPYARDFRGCTLIVGKWRGDSSVNLRPYCSKAKEQFEAVNSTHFDCYWKYLSGDPKNEDHNRTELLGTESDNPYGHMTTMEVGR
jgi:hypothetical protein